MKKTKLVFQICRYLIIFQNPLHYKKAIGCDPIDPSLQLSYFCNRNLNEKQSMDLWKHLHNRMYATLINFAHIYI